MAPLPGYVSNHVPCARTGFSADFGGYPGVALRRLGSLGSCGEEYARGEAPPGLREIDGGTIGIEDVPSILFNVGICQ
jgi:hypothetical protein